ncbi:MAG TPA: DUF1990 family protein [Solirubrobacteraceae bacterium]|nr:DUF1990 family protein [Solirubrobacteraceae bacterium]
MAALHDRPLNFDPETLGLGPGWERDDYRQPLAPEQPGPPQQGGSWETAAALSRSYAFADPALVEARYDPRVPLEQRELLLILHALGARIYAGVRVGNAGEERRSHGGRDALVSFWNYRTLEGHVEAGQRDFEVWKWLDSGAVEFRTHAVSRPAETNAVVRLGFRLLGPHKQVEFGRRACRRMALLNEASVRYPNGTATTENLDGRLLAVYLRDHHALLVALRELAQRMGTADRPDEQRAIAENIRRAADDDRACVEGFLDQLDSAPSRARHIAVWTGEKIGRLKLNGRVLRPSPLSAVTEFEGCRLLLESDRAMWTGLASLRLGPTDAAERASRAERLLAAAEACRLAGLYAATRPRLETLPPQTTRRGGDPRRKDSDSSRASSQFRAGA